MRVSASCAHSGFEARPHLLVDQRQQAVGPQFVRRHHRPVVATLGEQDLGVAAELLQVIAQQVERAFEAEGHLRQAPATLEQLRFAIDAELASARTFAHNHFKVELARRTVVSVLGEMLGLTQGDPTP